MKVLFAKYKPLTTKSNYFDRAANHENDDVLIITKHISFARLRKQLTSPEDFSQIEYGDTEIELSLTNNELSRDGKTISQFFDEYIEFYDDTRTMVMLCIVDSGTKRWACFVQLPVISNLSYVNGSEAYVLNIKAYDAMIEWKNLASTLIPGLGTGGVGNGNFFEEYMLVTIMGTNNFTNDTLRFINNVDPFAITGATCRVNKPLLAGILEGGNTNYTVYNFIKDLYISWGLVAKLEVPAEYETLAQSGRVYLSFRLMRRSDGEEVTLDHMSYYRTQLPKANGEWIFLKNRSYTVRTNLGSTFTESDVAHGILTNGIISYNFDSYNIYSPATIPNKCFVLGFRDINSGGTMEDPVYKDKITVIENHVIVRQIPIENISVVPNEMYNLAISNSYQSFVNSKKFGEDVYSGSQAYKRINNKISSHRIFCSSYFNWNGTEPGLDDIMYQINIIPINELRVKLKNMGSVEGTISLATSEPDLFDTFLVPYNGANELHSIISIEPNYNLIDGNNGMTAEYQTVRID